MNFFRIAIVLAIVAAIAKAFFAHIYLDVFTASVLGAAAVITLRLLASTLRWQLPKPKYKFENNK